MKTKEIKELKAKTNEELVNELQVVLRNQLNLRIKNSLGEKSNLHFFSKFRRTVARIKTILNERKKIK